MTLPDGTSVSKRRRPARRHHLREAQPSSSRCSGPNGTVTAGNACPLNDGAAAVVVMSDTKAAELGLTPLARIVATGVSGLSPEIMGLGPDRGVEAGAGAAPGMSIGDIDLFEINEAFAAQVLRLGPRARHRRGQAQRLTAARSRWATRSA